MFCVARGTMGSVQDTVSDKALRVVDGAIYVAKAAPLGTVVKASQAAQFSLHGTIGCINASDLSWKPFFYPFCGTTMSRLVDTASISSTGRLSISKVTIWCFSAIPCRCQWR